jgi:hypothetical protein
VRSRIEGLWWQFSVTERSVLEPSAISLLRIGRDRDRMLEVSGRAWQEDGTLSSRYWSEVAKETKDPAGIFYVWKGERPRHPNAPAIQGNGEIRLETPDRASGYWTTLRDRCDPERQDVGRLSPRRRGRPRRTRRPGQPAPRRPDRRADRGLAVDRELLSGGHSTSRDLNASMTESSSPSPSRR